MDLQSINIDMKFRIWILEHLSYWVRKWVYFKLQLRGYKNISKHANIERGVRLDKVYPDAIFIGNNTGVASGSVILAHESVYREESDPKMPRRKETRIGERCFIGVNAMILPGVTIGDECIIGAGAVVGNNIPPYSIVTGNPAKIIYRGIQLNDRHEVVSMFGSKKKIKLEKEGKDKDNK